ncbi:MAG: Ig-like domain-containing protein [Candidatus Thiodiazotropha endolucinida]
MQIKNMLLIKNKTLVVTVIALGITLSACGGGSSSDTSSTNSTDQNNAQDQAEQETPATGDETPPATEETAPPDPVQSNQRPAARVTASQQVTSGETVTLDGSGSSDPDGDTLNFIWSQTQGSSIGLVNVTNPTLSFIAPSVEQATTYSFQLQVSDGELSDSAAISITVTPTVDSTPPTIVARVPQPSATDVSVTTSISVDFDEPLLESSINSQSLQLSVDSSPVSASVSYDDRNNRLSLTPDAALTAATTYTVTLAGNLQDLAGNPVASVNWNFTTGSQYNLGETPQSTIDLCMSTSDKVMLSLINNARAVARSCGTTNYPAAPSLAWHCSLEQAAQGHSTSMADNDFFNHIGLDESDPGDRITATGYIWRTYGENIAAGYPDEESTVSALLDSPGHCANIMNPGFSEVGTAVAENSASTYVIYWTQNFADRF